MPRNRILIVEDDPSVRFGLRDFLEAKGYEVEEAEGVAEARRAFRQARPDAAVLDYSLPDGTALDLLPALQAIDSGTPLIILTAHGSIDLAVQSIKMGAEQFLTKPVELPALLAVLERVLENARNRQRNAARESQRAREDVDPFLGESPAIRRLAAEAGKVAAADSPILIQGPTGSGKGVLARWIHRQSPRAREAFVELNCAGLSRELLESELFGHEKGAFTGAVSRKQGLLEVAHRGTVFLDEIGDIDPAIQPKLLKVVEDRSFRRLGDVRDRVVDIRLVAATHHDLARRVAEGEFRSDLYFRISTIPLAVPALRERAGDIPLLAESLLRRLAGDLGRPRMSLDPAAVRALEAYFWPGNIRELRNVLERAILLSDPDREVLEPGDLRFEPPGALGEEEDALGLTLEEVERRHIERVLQAEGGRVPKAADRLGVPRSSLYDKIKKLGIEIERS